MVFAGNDFGGQMAEKILVFRRGSLGDGVVSLPALHALAERFPGSEVRILTNTPISPQAAALQAFLAGTGLIEGFFTFPPSGRSLAMWTSLAREIRRWGPDRLVYLSEPSGRLAVAQEVVFFLACGIRRFTGLPIGPALRSHRRIGPGLWESETVRLLRAVGTAAPPETAWEAGFSMAEETKAAGLLSGWAGTSRFIALCVGGKGKDKDWGDGNWRAVLSAITEADPALGLLAVGAAEEAERAANLATVWRGPVLNLCGKAEPRISALAMKQALFYLGHDSGPMHLAALVGIPCVAVFSARSKPGVWFPAGTGHHILYPREATDGIAATAGMKSGGTSIEGIDPKAVIEACRSLLG